MKIEQKIHSGWLETTDCDAYPYEDLQIFGKYQYIMSSEKGKISVIELKDYFVKGRAVWEIYSLEGKLFNDVIRFSSYKEAKDMCEKILG